MKTKTSLSDLLVQLELVSRESMDEFVADAPGNDIKLAAAIVSSGQINGEEMASLLSQHLNVERYLPQKYSAESKYADLIPSNMAMTNQIVPLVVKGDLLKLGMVDPTDIDTLDLVEQKTNLEADAVLCTESELYRLLSVVYGVNIGLGGMMDHLPEEAEANPDEYETSADENIEVNSLINMAEGAPIVRLVNMIIAQAVRERASDIHISPENKQISLRYRRDGKLIEVSAPPKHMLLPIISRIKVLSKMDISVSRIPQDGRFTVMVDNREINIRASSIPTIYGENVVLRLLDMSASMYSMDKLGMHSNNRQQIETLIRRPYGMILSTGPTGSGKSTSLYAILHELNAPDTNIITVEDPVEYRMDGIRQVELNTRAGMTFASGLRSILRQDPDVIMVGEIRDPETATIAVQAALTGHLVLSTVHTNTAVGSITRMADMGLEPFLISSTLMVAIAQRLMRRVCSFCAEDYEPDKVAREFLDLDMDAAYTFKRAKGCSSCMYTGYQGRIGIFEVLVIDEHIQSMISTREPENDIVEYARQTLGMITLKEDALDKVMKGVTTVEEAMSKVVVI